jgi:hypothetical protein
MLLDTGPQRYFKVSKLELYLSRKSLLTSLCQREELVPLLGKEGQGEISSINRGGPLIIKA